MKKLIIGLTLLASVSSFASSFTCQSYLPGDDGWKEVLISVDEEVITIHGFEKREIIESVEMEIDGDKLVGCKDYICVQGLTPNAPSKNDNKRSLYSNLYMYLELDKTERSLSDVAFKDINVAKIVKGKVHVAKFGGHYPNIGVYEYFDKNNKLVARYLHQILPLPCN